MNIKVEKATNIPHELIFTDAAANKVRELIDEEKDEDLKLRVFVAGGGCAGFQYGFSFDKNAQEDDVVIEKTTAGNNKPVKLLVDPFSFQYLSSAEIDYKEDLNGAQFVIRNPNVKTTCSCGSSFAVND